MARKAMQDGKASKEEVIKSADDFLDLMIRPQIKDSKFTLRLDPDFDERHALWNVRIHADGYNLPIGDVQVNRDGTLRHVPTVQQVKDGIKTAKEEDGINRSLRVAMRS